MNMAEYYIDKVTTRIAGSVFILVGIVAVGTACWRVKSDYTLRNDKWLCVTGVIERAGTEWRSSGKYGGGATWLRCVYSYEVSGSRYRSNCIGLGGASDDEHELLIKQIGHDLVWGINNRKARGKTIPVWIKEEDPSVSVLINPQQRTYWMSVFLCFLALTMPFVGIFCWIISFAGQKS
jgi:hypothetical protein